MASLRLSIVLCVILGSILVSAIPVPDPQPGGFGPKHEHYIIHVPYHVHTVHHHHKSYVPVYKHIYHHDHHEHHDHHHDYHHSGWSW